MIAAILKIAALLAPFLIELFSKEAKAERSNHDFDKALAEGDADSISRLLSERYDRVRSKSSGDPG